MAKANATVLQLPGGDFHLSNEFSARLGKLSRGQASAIIRIVEAEISGQTVESLFAGNNKICNRSTYYRPRGWIHKHDFIEALEMARREVRGQRMTNLVADALDELKATTPLAARDLRRQIVGDEAAIDALAMIAHGSDKGNEERLSAITSLGVIGTARATEAILALVQDGKLEIRLRAIEMIGASAAGISPQRRRAAVDVLDRADELTADKGGKPDDELDAEIERRLAQLAQGSQDANAGAFEPATAERIADKDSAIAPINT